MPLATEKLQAATPTILMWVNSGACSCKIEDYMNTDPAWKGITEKQIVEIALANGKVCAVCNEKANTEYKASKVPFVEILDELKVIKNEAKSIGAGIGSKSSKSTGTQKPPTV